jgi:hypothetical protein
MINALQPLLDIWFSYVNTNPNEFVIPTCSYASLDNGIYPPTIIDYQGGFLLLMDMRYGLAWELHCDRVLTITTGPGLQHFRTFLQRGSDGITTNTCLNAAVPGHLCPNFGFHFKHFNKVWPPLPILLSTSNQPSHRPGWEPRTTIP